MRNNSSDDLRQTHSNAEGRDGANHDHIDRLLEAGVATYSAEEPRVGLTQRVIANSTSIIPADTRLSAVRRKFAGFFGSLVRIGRSASPLRRALTAAESRVPHVSHLKRGFSPAQVLGYALALIACVLAFWTVKYERRHIPGTAAKITYPNRANPSAITSLKPTAAGQSQTSLAAGSSARQRLARPKSPTASTDSSLLASNQPESARKPEVFPTPSPLTAEERALVALTTGAPEEVKKSLTESALESDQPISIAAIHIEPLTPLAQPAPVSTPSNPTP
ncbi:MAG TPA: hypothetical protein VGD64_09725 [Acidisarcina sp.]